MNDSATLRELERIQKEAQLDALLEAASDSIYFKDRESRFLRISKQQMLLFAKKNPDKNFGDDPKAAVGKTDFTFFSEEHAKKAFDDEQEIMRTGQPKEMEEKETWPDGTITYVLTNKYCLKDSEGNVIGTFGISRNITHRKKNEEALSMAHEYLIRSKNELSVAYQQLEELNSKLAEANRRLDIDLEHASKVARFGFWEWDIYAEGAQTVKGTDEVYRIFNIAPQQQGVKMRDLQQLVHQEDRYKWDKCFSDAMDAKPVTVYLIRLRFHDGSIKYIDARAEVGEQDEYGLPKTIRGYVQDVTDKKYHEIRSQGLELTIRGFQHMIPGKADEAIGCLECIESNGKYDFEIQKTLAFMFMVRHKSDEVKSLFYEQSYFQYYTLCDIFDKAWPIALDLAKVGREDLNIIYAHDTSDVLPVNGAFYTAAVNVLSNARLYGSAPFIVWTLIHQERFVAIIADGGPNDRAKTSRPKSGRDSGVGIPLANKVLGIVGGDVRQMSFAEIEKQYQMPPPELVNCKTFFVINIVSWR